MSEQNLTKLINQLQRSKEIHRLTVLAVGYQANPNVPPVDLALLSGFERYAYPQIVAAVGTPLPQDALASNNEGIVLKRKLVLEERNEIVIMKALRSEKPGQEHIYNSIAKRWLEVADAAFVILPVEATNKLMPDDFRYIRLKWRQPENPEEQEIAEVLP